MRGRLTLGVLTVLALVLGLASLGLSRPERSKSEQIIFPPTDTPTPTATSGVPTDTPTPTTIIVQPSETPTGIPPSDTPAPPGVGPTRTLRPPGAPATPSTGIKVNACARVVGAQGLILGSAPGFAAGHVQTVGRDDVVFVIAGPQRSDGLWWWQVNTRGGVIGWGINDQILPYAGECFGLVAAPPPSVLPAVTPVSSGAAAPSGGATATTVAQSQLPNTGSDNSGLLFAGALTIVLLLAGLIRRRSQSAV